MKKFEITITEKNAHQRIDKIISENFAEFSRSQIQKNGIFKLNGKAKSGKTKTKIGEVWEFSLTENPAKNLAETPAWDFPLDILCESASWAVINKPLDVAVHPSPSAPEPRTIINALVHHFGQNLAKNSDELDGQTVAKPGLVHRLDKTTSGVLLIAKTNLAHQFFQENWSKVEKTYYAVVENRGKSLPQKGKIYSPIARDLHNRQKMSVSLRNSAKKALTFFEKIKSNDQFSLLKIKIPTGRTHQIRVHLSAIGFPIFGDEKYGGSAAERVFLHAWKLKFPDPDQNEKLVEVAALLPTEFNFF